MVASFGYGRALLLLLFFAVLILGFLCIVLFCFHFSMLYHHIVISFSKSLPASKIKRRIAESVMFFFVRDMGRKCKHTILQQISFCHLGNFKRVKNFLVSILKLPLRVHEKSIHVLLQSVVWRVL